ncbi:MAG: glutamate--tRNA ligase [Candidatus Ryanbacteria bacterium RIFCSPHIGHO2_02_FULL_48_12]|uniref:Glutamate--tRNA ligase n=1 Tax=Candidatus Ryanbacteria bacterium RIFCSPHIGHO2_01_FULL_48_27 TaxID=1802115 RepID=A0A1G2G374_9BACT|nr:MAG: glutamate--tRNA ligase [Candidatus Ryanbacteria bacterium RIFCSPHIGHO2_01_FULL_48_27]OGZ49261.1 MAG: glutamate--tRNA ligase [Candidatus Ryanbacteria bacterium RIFCSPHIGHO2_02_FULL_48_12]
MSNQPAKPIRTRMAPSPTGFLHIGTARTALFNFLFTRHESGVFVLRIEDTDLERSEKRFEDDIINGLHWLGITWDEGPIRQSERLDIYETHLRQLLDSGKAFHCTHDPASLEAEKKEQMTSKSPLRHICTDRDTKRKEGIIRLRNDATGDIMFNDIIRGNIMVKAEELGDFSLAKNPKTPLFNFANVVDDYDMQISHVIRGEDHIPNTPRQILIQKALGFPDLAYAHLPLILGQDRSKMSKRDGATSIGEYRALGYLPEALANFIALMGWHATGDREIFSLNELVQEFSLERVQKSGAVFDIEKLNWLNAEYIRKLPLPDLTMHLVPYLIDAGLITVEGDRYRTKDGRTVDQEYLNRISALEAPRLKRLSDIAERVAFFFDTPQYEADLLSWKGKQDFQTIRQNIDEVEKIVRNIESSNFSPEDLKEVIMPFAEAKGRGEVLWPLRALLSGKEASPDPFDLMATLGKDETLARIQRAKSIPQIQNAIL